MKEKAYEYISNQIIEAYDLFNFSHTVRSVDWVGIDKNSLSFPFTKKNHGRTNVSDNGIN